MIEDDRCDYEDESEDAGDAASLDDAARATEIIMEVQATAQRAIERLIALNFIDRFQPGFMNDCGWQEGKRLSDADLQAAVSGDVRVAFTAWLKPDIRERIVE